LQCNALQCNANLFHRKARQRIVRHRIALQGVARHCKALQGGALRCMTRHCITRHPTFAFSNWGGNVRGQMIKEVNFPTKKEVKQNG